MSLIKNCCELSENFKCQIEHLKDTIVEREKRIMQLSTMLARITQGGQHPTESDNTIEYGGNCCNAYDNIKIHELETKVQQLTTELDKTHKQENFLHIEARKLNEELNESKQKNGNLLAQTKRLSSLLKSQEEHRIELARKYESLDKSFEDQSRKLRAATTRLATLNERFQFMEKCQSEHNLECNLLREEVLALKEKEADLLGRQKSIQGQLLKAEKELYTAHDVIKEQQCILERTEASHKETIKHLKDINNEMKRKMLNLVEDYKRLDEEYKRLRDVCAKNDKLIETMHKWKESQQRMENRTRDIFKKYEDHIRLLLSEKQRSVEEYRDLNRDYNIIQDELDRLKTNAITLPGYDTPRQTSEAKLRDRISVIRDVSKRLADQSLLLKEDKLVPHNYSFSSDQSLSKPKE